MFKLVLALGGKVLNRNEYRQDRVLVGRHPDCDLVIDNLGVSRNHCEIVKEGDFYVLRDLRSNNGTYVNGKRVTVYNMNDGDEIAIGKFTIGFSTPQKAELKAAPEEGKVAGGEFTMALDRRALDQRQREKASKLKAYLLIKGPKSKKETIFLDRSIFTIGKKHGCNFKVPGWFVAKKHAIIFRDESGFRLVDTSQKSRTYVNDTSIDDHRLKDGDIIKIGGKKMQFMVGSPMF